jgi:hypothetical protein
MMCLARRIHDTRGLSMQTRWIAVIYFKKYRCSTSIGSSVRFRIDQAEILTCFPTGNDS